jgi:hypothetical protein
VAATLLACTNPQAAGDRLVQELPRAYPEQISAVSFENNPLMDPATLFIDVAPSMDPDQQLHFLCDEIMPRVSATKAAIGVTVSYGWWDTDCD